MVRKALCLLLAVLQLWLVSAVWARLSDHEGGEGFYTEPLICTVSLDELDIGVYHGGNMDSLALWVHEHAQETLNGYTFVSQDWAAFGHNQADCPYPRGSIFAVDQNTLVVQIAARPIFCEFCDTGTHHPEFFGEEHRTEFSRDWAMALGAALGAALNAFSNVFAIDDVRGFYATLATPEAQRLSRELLLDAISRGVIRGMLIGAAVGLGVNIARSLLERDIILVTGHLLTDIELQEMGLGPDPADPSGNIPNDDATCCTPDMGGGVDPADPSGNTPADDSTCCD